DPDGFNNLGFAKRKLGRYAEAVQDYTKALALKPDYTNALYGLAFCKNELGQREAAIVDLEKLLKITPNDQDTKVLLAEIRAKMAEKK
ncbi:MAG: tetratricopeptide repeat protein, partial [bacterium]|nr:tetratricopeptide repeat protein [bacterium]